MTGRAALCSNPSFALGKGTTEIAQSSGKSSGIRDQINPRPVSGSVINLPDSFVNL